MDQKPSSDTLTYQKSDDLKEPSRWKRLFTLATISPMLIIKLLIVAFALVFVTFQEILFCFVPRKRRDIRGQVAVVTGGSNGIGREICLELARCGCNVACLDIDFDAALKLCTELRECGVKANAYKVDVSDPKRIEDVKQEINKDLGSVDILVNNAGLIPINSFRGIDVEGVRRVMDVNVLAHFWTTRVFIEDMIERQSGYIVGIASMIAFYPLSTAVAYTTSKFAIKGFMDALTRESQHENWGVKTLTVFPHVTNTSKEVMNSAQRMVPLSTLERIGMQKPIEVAKETVRAMRSDDGYITIPRYYLFLVRVYQSWPVRIQKLFDDLVMPRITSNAGHTIAMQEY